jgi:hypothetical protein
MNNNPLAYGLLNVHLFREPAGSTGGPGVMCDKDSVWLFMGWRWGLVISRRLPSRPHDRVECDNANRTGHRAPAAGP